MAREVTSKIKVNKNFFKIVESSASKGLFEAGKVLEAKSKSLAPVDTGKLKRSIKITKESRNKIRVGSDLPYALAQEFGSVASGRVIPAHPYLRPALKESRSKMQAAFNKSGKNK